MAENPYLGLARSAVALARQFGSEHTMDNLALTVINSGDEQLVGKVARALREVWELVRSLDVSQEEGD